MHSVEPSRSYFNVLVLFFTIWLYQDAIVTVVIVSSTLYSSRLQCFGNYMEIDSLCDGQEECGFIPNSLWSNPCIGVNKQTEVHYHCDQIPCSENGKYA